MAFFAIMKEISKVPTLALVQQKETLFMNSELFTAYEQEEMAKQLQESVLDYAKQEGLAEGRVEGRKEATRAMALSLLEQGIPIEAISTASGMTIDEIEALKKNR